MNNADGSVAAEILKQIGQEQKFNSDNALAWLKSLLGEGSNDKKKIDQTGYNAILTIISKYPALLLQTIQNASEDIVVSKWLLKQLVPKLGGSNAESVQNVIESTARLLSRNPQSWLDANLFRDAMIGELTKWGAAISSNTNNGSAAASISLNLMMVLTKLSDESDLRYYGRHNEIFLIKYMDQVFRFMKLGFASPAASNHHRLLTTTFLKICLIQLARGSPDCSRLALWIENIIKWLLIVLKSSEVQSVPQLTHLLLRLAWIFISNPTHTSGKQDSLIEILDNFTPNDLELELSRLYLRAAIKRDMSLLPVTGSTFSDPRLELLRQRTAEKLSALCHSTPVQSTSSIQTALELLNMHFGSLEAVGEYVRTSFHLLKDGEKLKLIRNIGRLACLLNGSFDPTTMCCKFCDTPLRSRHPYSSVRRPCFKGFHVVFCCIISSHKFSSSNRLRVEALLALKRVLMCFQPESPFQAGDEISAWLMTCLYSTSREVRVLSGQILPLFIGPADTAANTDVIFHFLSSINLNKELYLRETTLMAWVQLAGVLEGERLNFILMKVIDFLGSEDSFLTAVASHELQQLAKRRNKTTYQLCTPFWNTISVLVVKSMNKKRQLLDRVSEALEISPADFLSRTLSFTVPYLVMARSYDIVDSIAIICNYRTTKKIYLDHVANILAVLLSQEVERPELFAENRWFDIDESFKLVEFSAIIWPNHLEIIVEILKLYQEDNESKTIRLLYALNYLGSLKYADKTQNSTRFPFIEKLFNENLILQLVTKFSDTVRNVRGRMSYTSKLQSLNGIAMMIRCAPTKFYNAVPLICTLLQSALETDLLQRTAFYTWSLMLQNLDKSHLSHVMDLTLSVIVQKWSSLTYEARQQAFSLVENLFTQKGADLRDVIREKGIPSLSSVPELRDLGSLFVSATTLVPPTLKLNMLIHRCKNENIYVIRQSVTEIRDFLLENQDFIEKRVHDKSDYLIATLLRVLLNEMYIFRNVESDIPTLCAQCIGLVGAVDHHFVNIANISSVSSETTELEISEQQRRDVIVINNFAEAQESIDFVIYLIEEFLVRIFRASTDPSLQMFLAYGIQEYLKFCGLSTTSIESSTRESQYWNRFSYITKSTLLPLLSSKYTAPPAPASNCSYPIFNQTISYSDWLHNFTYDLLSRAKGGNVEKIFGVFRRIMRGKLPFQSMISFLLPFAALNVYLGDSTGLQRVNISREIRLILVASRHLTDDMSEFYRAAFSLVDYFTKWNRAKKKEKSKNNTVGISAPIDTFLSEIPSELMALRSFECKSYPRAIMYWEQYLRLVKHDVDKSRGVYDKLRQIYSNIGESDSLEGIFSMSSSPSIEQQIVQYESMGKWDFALECYEALMKENEKWDVELESSALHCLKESGRYDDLLTRLESYVVDDYIPEWWVTLGIEVSWLAGNFSSLQKWLSRTVDDSYEVNVGRALIALESKQHDELEYWIVKARTNISNELSAQLVTSLSQCIDSRVKLHALADLESICSLSFVEPSSLDHRTISGKLDKRLAIVGSDYNARRYLLSLRRSLFTIGELEFSKQEVGITWVKSSRDSRKQNQVNLAIQASLRAMVSGNPMANVEYAKILWSLGEQRKATSLIEELGRETASLSPDETTARERARIALLHTKWLDESAQKDSDDISARYRNVCKLDPTWEKAYYELAQYFNKVLSAQALLPIPMKNTSFLNGTYVKMTVLHYYKSLQFGCKYAFESLPRMITIWLDFSENLIKPTTNSKGPALAKLLAERRDILTSINNTLKRSIVKIPTYILYLALSQLLSRITHSDQDVLDVILSFIVEIAKKYPRQALWSIYGIVNSQNKERSFLGREVVARLRASNTGGIVSSLLTPAAQFTENMIKICNFNIEGQKVQISLSRDVGYNKSVVPCDLVVPVQSSMQVALPSIPEELKNHIPFPEEVTIADVAVVQHSLQRPKRIVIIGKNGQMFKILCKPHDDVRKDARLMEFTSTVDKLLLKDNETSKRMLRIKTYHVTPLNEDCGLIEWVDGAVPIRSILFKLLTAHGTTVNWAEAKKLLTGVAEDALSGNFRKLRDKYFPVLYEWFLESFPEPSSWLLSRTNFSRSTAVMSILGYVLGLGDRHGENLLLLNRTGEVLHVDFDCLFDKGLELELPERVPFRLTQQMVDALGATGYEGVFRKSAEVTLRLLRENEEMLMTNLETFLHDPIVDWSVKRKRSPNQRRMINGLMAARSPEEALSSIRHKIRGIRYQESIPLSVSGQVEYLVLQATSDENLSKMYIGWGAFL